MKISCAAFSMLLSLAASTGVYAQTNLVDLLEMSQKLDRVDKQDLRELLRRADGCTADRDFNCSESNIEKANKLAKDSADKKLVDSSRQKIVSEKQLIAKEARELQELQELQERMRLAEERRQQREDEAREMAQSSQNNSGGNAVNWNNYLQQQMQNNQRILNSLDSQQRRVDELRRQEYQRQQAQEQARRELAQQEERERQRQLQAQRIARENAEQVARERQSRLLAQRDAQEKERQTARQPVAQVTTSGQREPSALDRAVSSENSKNTQVVSDSRNNPNQASLAIEQSRSNPAPQTTGSIFSVPVPAQSFVSAYRMDLSQSHRNCLAERDAKSKAEYDARVQKDRWPAYEQIVCVYAQYGEMGNVQGMTEQAQRNTCQALSAQMENLGGADGSGGTTIKMYSEGYPYRRASDPGEGCECGYDWSRPGNARCTYFARFIVNRPAWSSYNKR